MLVFTNFLLFDLKLSSLSFFFPLSFSLFPLPSLPPSPYAGCMYVHTHSHAQLMFNCSTVTQLHNASEPSTCKYTIWMDTPLACFKGAMQGKVVYFGQVILAGVWVHYGYTTGTLRVRYGYTTGTLWVHYGYTTGTLRVHYGYTMGTLWVHYGYATGTLRVHYGYATGTLRVRYGYTTGTLRVHYGYTMGTLWVHYGYTRVHKVKLFI